VKRREFITLLGGAAAVWPLAARAQQPTMPVIGFMHSASREPFESMLAGFRRGLNELGFVEGRNLTIEYRWAEGRFDRLPSLAAELVQRPVAIIVAAGGNVSVLAARAVTSTIPIVFPGMDDPVKLGVVASFSHPGGNATGVSLFNAVLGAKRLELLRELVPQATVVALLVNPTNPTTEDQVRDLEEAARASNLRIQVVNIKSASDIDPAFATMKEYRAAALVIGADPLLLNQRDHLIVLAARDRLPTIYSQREFAAIGGLISYGVDFPENYRQAGVYVGRILKGEKPADLPVVQPTKFELAINLKTAKALGLTVPDKLLATADEVIE
jgi:putative tryptophan/tyrosine transport system substrate-binding protein